MKKLARNKGLVHFRYIKENKLREDTIVIIEHALRKSKNGRYGKIEDHIKLRTDLLEIWMPGALSIILSFKRQPLPLMMWVDDMDLEIDDILRESGYPIPDEDSSESAK